jgi:hypothetical protein
MAGTSFKSLTLGFIAGAIATVTVHELISYALLQQGLFGRVPWSLDPVAVGPLADLGIPQIASDMFWGGIWGAIFALIWGDPPQGALSFKGAALGIVGPAIIGVFTLVPLLTSKFPLFFGGEVDMIWPVLVILAGFGAATGWLYGFLTSGCRLP